MSVSLSSKSAFKNSNPKQKVGIICSTYRDPNNPSLTRLYGIASLIEQVIEQDFDGDAVIMIVDDSPEPHPFLMGLGDKLKEKVFYFHTPERANLSSEIEKNFPEATKFFPKNEDFENNTYWKDIIKQVQDWKRFLPFDYEFAKTFTVDMVSQVLAPRPTIGMKKNFACQAYLENFGSVPDAFIYVDDDDFRSPTYIRDVLEGIKGANFARMTKTYVHNIAEDDKNKFWAEIDFKPQQDSHGNWYLPDEVMDSDCYKFEDGDIATRPVSDLYARNLLLAWPIISHDGALHNYTGETWQSASEEFGGFFPTSFSEDIITHKMMHGLSGFQAKNIDAERPQFLRCSDGRNCSDFYVTKLSTESQMPKWVHDSVAPLYSALKMGRDYKMHSDRLFDIGLSYGDKQQRRLPRLVA